MKKVFLCLLVLTLVIVANAQNDAQKDAQKMPAGNAPQMGENPNPVPGVIPKDEARIAKEVRHELLMNPYYSLFDSLGYKVEGNTVTLYGQVTQPIVKSTALANVKHIEGVEKVIDNIEVLPPNPNDDRIRREVARAIFNYGGMSKYAMSAVPPVHIIVKNGHVRLEGVVINQMDKQIAEMQAKSVPGVFSVENDLQVVPGS